MLPANLFGDAEEKYESPQQGQQLVQMVFKAGTCKKKVEFYC